MGINASPHEGPRAAKLSFKDEENSHRNKSPLLTIAENNPSPTKIASSETNSPENPHTQVAFLNQLICHDFGILNKKLRIKLSHQSSERSQGTMSPQVLRSSTLKNKITEKMSQQRMETSPTKSYRGEPVIVDSPCKTTNTHASFHEETNFSVIKIPQNRLSKDNKRSRSEGLKNRILEVYQRPVEPIILFDQPHTVHGGIKTVNIPKKIKRLSTVAQSSGAATEEKIVLPPLELRKIKKSASSSEIPKQGSPKRHKLSPFFVHMANQSVRVAPLKINSGKIGNHQNAKQQLLESNSITERGYSKKMNLETDSYKRQDTQPGSPKKLLIPKFIPTIVSDRAKKF